MRYYIASPGFNEEQINKIHEVEKVLDSYKVDYYSPFTHGGKLTLGDDNEVNKLVVKLMFEENIKQIDSCDKMVAIVNDFDKGTLFEIGYFIGSKCIKLVNKGQDLLLIGNDSKLLNHSIHNSISNAASKSALNSAVMDLRNKTDPELYITMGILYSRCTKIYGYLPKNYQSNVMTAAILTGYMVENGSKSFYDYVDDVMNPDIQVITDYSMGSFLRSNKIE